MRVLLICNDENVRDRIHRAAHEQPSAGLDIQTVSSPTAGLEALRSRPADCVLLDCALPDDGATAFLEALRSQTDLAEVTPVVALDTQDPEMSEQSASVPMNARMAMETGAMDYIDKAAIRGATLFATLDYARRRKMLMPRLPVPLHADALTSVGEVVRLLSDDFATTCSLVYGYRELLEANLQSLRDVVVALRQRAENDPKLQATVEEVLEEHRVGEAELSDVDSLLDLDRGAWERLGNCPRLLSSLGRAFNDDEAELLDLNQVAEAAWRSVTETTYPDVELTPDFGELPAIAGHRDGLQRMVNILLVHAIANLHEEQRRRVEMRTRYKEGSAQGGILILRVAAFGDDETPDAREAQWHVGSELDWFICKELVRRHGGELRETSEAAGPVFTVRLPRDTGLIAKR